MSDPLPPASHFFFMATAMIYAGIIAYFVNRQEWASATVMFVFGLALALARICQLLERQGKR